jgi:glycosyltransferase involved in cell wall biosynthesis
MNILIITGIFPPDIGGPASYVPAIAASLVQRGYTISIITLSDTINHNDSIYSYPVIRILRSTFKPWRVLKTIRTILFEGKKANVLFVNGLALEAVLANFFLKKPLAQKLVGDFAWERAYSLHLIRDSVEEFQNKQYGIKIEWLKKLRAFWVKRSDSVITPSQHIKNIVKTWGIPEEKITIIHNAIDTVNPAVADDARPALLQDLDTTKKILVSNGRLFPFKNFDELILVMDAFPEAHLYIIGDGPLHSHLESLIKQKSLQDRVHLTGGLSKAEVFSFFKKNIDFFCFIY